MPTAILEVLMNLGSFFKLRAVIQREILTEFFGNINDEEVIATDEELSKLKLGAKTVESYIAEIKREISKLKKSAESIPAKISELESLREEWRSVKDTRPTCGQQIDSEKAEKIREQIALNGKRITGEIEQLKTVLSKINERRETALQKVRTLHEKVKSQQYDSTEYDLAGKGKWKATWRVGTSDGVGNEVKNSSGKVESRLIA